MVVMPDKTTRGTTPEGDVGVSAGEAEFADDPAHASQYTIQTLVLGMSVLEAVVRSSQERRISDVAKELGTTKWRIFRHLHTLCEAGYLQQNSDTDRFSVGPKMYSLLEALPHRFGFLQTARGEMLRLRERCGHTVVAAGLVNDDRIVILDAEVSTQVVQYTLKIGSTFDLYSSAHGKVALAFGPPKLLENVMARPLARHTEYTITQLSDLRRELDDIRQRGWAMSAEEAIRGINAIAAPIVSSRGYEGSISLFGSIEVLGRDPNPEDIEALVASARTISQLLN